jgi:ATP-dependent 26S proteasome regulatory subunit
MEQTIHKSLNTYYTILRDYQYDIENKIKEIINNVKYITNNTVDNNNYDIILETFNDKKVFSIITKLLDIIKMKNWVLNIKDINNWIVMYKNEIICNIIIQQKKVVLTHNQIELTFNINKDNHQNFEIIKLL